MQRNKLDVGQLSPGMKLAEPITNAAGIALMPAGIRLTPMFIIRLKKWNIPSVYVIVESPQEGQEEEGQEEEARPESKTRTHSGRIASNIPIEQESFARSVAEDVARRFANVRDNPLMMRLRNISIKRLVIHGQNGMLNVMRRGRLANAEDKS